MTMKKFLRFDGNIVHRLKKYAMAWGEPHGAPGDWRAGAPIGNGNFGAMQYGYPDNLSFALSKTDIWNRFPDTPSTFKGKSFEHLRDLFSRQDLTEFNRLCAEPEPEMKSHATTAGIFRIRLHDGDSCRAVTQLCSIADGVSYLRFLPAGIVQTARSWGITEVNSFVSREHQVLAIEVKPTANDPGYKYDSGIRRNYPPEAAPLGTINWELSRPESALLPRATVKKIDDTVILRQDFFCGDYYVVAIRFAGTPCEAFPCDSRITGTCRVEDTQAVHAFLTIVSSGECPDPEATAIARLDAAVAAGFDVILASHRNWWSNFWNKSFILINNSGVEKIYYTSLYMCASCIDHDRQSPGLQGVWIKENVPAWLGDFHTNVNLQAFYWGLFTANHLEMTEPYLKLLESMYNGAKRDTEQFFKMRGVRFPHAGSIDGTELTQGDWATSLGISVGGSGWLAILLWDIFRYGQNKQLLCERIYPLLKEIAIFYNDYLVWNGELQRYELFPSLFFEALCPRFSSWGRNSLYELTLVRKAFDCASAAATTLGVDAEQILVWQDKRDRLVEFPTDDNNEWIGFDGRDLRQFGSHQFALPPVFPGELVSLWHGPEEWRSSALSTMKSKWLSSSVTGKPWCGGQGLRELVRMGEGEWVMREAATPVPDENGGNINNFNYRWSAGYLQPEHICGMSSVLGDMLLLQTGDVLRIMPCMPKNITAAFYNLRAPGAFLLSGEMREGEIAYVIIESLAGCELKMANPWQQQKIRLKNAITNAVLSETADATVSLQTTPALMLICERVAHPIESFNIIKYED